MIVQPTAYRRSPLATAVIASVLLCTACKLSLPDLADAGVRVDEGVDAPGSEPTPHDGPAVADEAAPAVDVALDAGWPRVRACSDPEAIDEASKIGLRTPALSVDGLSLYAQSGADWYVITRAAVDAPFGTWTAASGLGNLEDVSFYVDPDGAQRVIAALGSPGKRIIIDCAVGDADCGEGDALTITLPPQVLGTDMDGPDMILLAGELFFAFNSGADAYQRLLLLAHRQGDAWFAEQLVDPPATGDDPALSPDGLVAAFAPDEDLWVATRRSPDGPFSRAEALPPPINSPSWDGAPEIGALPGSDPSRIELLFDSNRGARYTIYRSVCEVVRD